MNAWEKWRREPENCEVDLETRIRDMLVVAPDDSDMRRYARDLAIRYRQVREKFEVYCVFWLAYGGLHARERVGQLQFRYFHALTPNRTPETTSAAGTGCCAPHRTS